MGAICSDGGDSGKFEHRLNNDVETDGTSHQLFQNKQTVRQF